MGSNRALVPSPDIAASSPSPQFELVRKSLFERVLSIITDVRGGEGLGALLLTADFYCAAWRVLSAQNSTRVLDPCPRRRGSEGILVSRPGDFAVWHGAGLWLDRHPDKSQSTPSVDLAFFDLQPPAIRLPGKQGYS